MRARGNRAVAISSTLTLLGVLALPALAIDASPRQVLIEATIVELNRTDIVRFGIGTLKPRQRPSQGDVEFFVPLLEDAVTGLNQLNLDVGIYPEIDGTLDGTTAQSLFGVATQNLDVAIEALERLDRAKVISKPLITAFSAEVAGIAAFQGRPMRFSARSNKLRREVTKYQDLFNRAAQRLFPIVGFWNLGDYFEPFDNVKKKNFETFAGLLPGGQADLRLRSRRGNTVMEIRGSADSPVDGYVTTPMQVGNDFAATADLGVLLRVTPKIVSSRDGITMYIEIEQPDEGTFQRAGFEFGVDGIDTAFTSDQTGLLSTTPISSISGIDRTSVTSFVEVRDGTAVLGGLFDPESGEGDKIPVVLDQLPVLGSLFRVKVGAENVTKKKRAEVDNLFLFLTPRLNLPTGD